MTHVLVTGGAGYIGSHVARALAIAGYTPITYDNLSLGHRHAVQFGPFEEGDIADPERLSAVLGRYRPAAVLHLAARSNVGESVRNPLLYYSANTAASLTLLRTLAAHRIDRIVFSSTCATYGLPQQIPVCETTPQRPINPYGRSKLMVEEVLREAGRKGCFHSVALRYFNAAGAAEDGSIGEEHDPETHLIPLALAAARDQARTLEVFGADYATPDGTCIRDYVHVEDIAAAHVQALGHLLSGALRGFTSLNIGSGLGLSVRDVVAAAQAVTGRQIAVRRGPRRAGDPSVLIADFTAARALLGYAPRHRDIEGVIDSAWRFMVLKSVGVSHHFMPAQGMMPRPGEGLRIG